MDYGITDLESDLSIGREIEFTFENERYSISRVSTGFSFTKYNEPSTMQNYTDHTELLGNAKIGNELLTDIFKERRIKIEVIF
ncbi:hypothetical protein BSK49_16410 [Paenibacillus odorifer]|jgi:hypothetical protein|uniref:Uncharacterized protein n=1 Tax=Paenibacillus odorifer TaxID=189426 RepID=A0ABX3GYI9_9BACL|nr:hypothetical protein [Paenibacillus odorifer]OMD38509.1 hypothetical protein BSO21_04105 [Paenibacillus odorifer]OMD88230.1 hypothetical protein BSK49_16410 [Paenibacillus odorifer]